MIKLEKLFSHQLNHIRKYPFVYVTNFLHGKVTNKQLCVSGFDFTLFKGPCKLHWYCSYSLNCSYFRKNMNQISKCNFSKIQCLSDFNSNNYLFAQNLLSISVSQLRPSTHHLYYPVCSYGEGLSKKIFLR